MGTDCVRLYWIGLMWDWIQLERIVRGLDRIDGGLDSMGKDCWGIGLDCIALDWIGLDRIGRIQ
jgi:hypothetical protein